MTQVEISIKAAFTKFVRRVKPGTVSFGGLGIQFLSTKDAQKLANKNKISLDLMSTYVHGMLGMVYGSYRTRLSAGDLFAIENALKNLRY